MAEAPAAGVAFHRQEPELSCHSGKAPVFAGRRPTYRSFSSSGFSSSFSPRSGRFYDARFEEASYFLDSCYLCKKPLPKNKDIFMYRGDTPFCSEECRQEQIEMDEASEKRYSMSMKASAASRTDTQSSSSKKSHKYQVRTSTVVAG